MPLSGKCAVIARVGKRVAKGVSNELRMDGRPVVGRAILVRIEPGQEAGALRSTQWVGAVCTRKARTRCGKTVHIGGVQVGVSGARHGPCKLLVGDNEEDVGLFGHGDGSIWVGVV